MLKAAALVAAALVAVVLALAAWLYVRAVRRGQQAYAALLERVAPASEALDRGEAPANALLERYAADRETRKALFDVLQSRDRLDLFPAQHLTPESLAEADLVAWLCHPNELGAPPSEIELVATVPSPGAPAEESAYFVFRYRMHEPHWAARDGWLAGVAGPFAIAGPPASSAMGTFSRFEAIDSRTPDEHVALAHKSAFRRAPADASSAPGR